MYKRHVPARRVPNMNTLDTVVTKGTDRPQVLLQRNWTHGVNTASTLTLTILIKLTDYTHTHTQRVWHKQSFDQRGLNIHWVIMLRFNATSTHYEDMPIQKYRNFHLQKIENFQIKNSDIFHTFAQNIDCGYSLEPPRRGGSNEYPQSIFWANIRKIMYTPVNPSFTI